MKLREIFLFEFNYQIRRVWYWLIFAAMFVVAFMLTRDGSLSEALMDEFFVNSPFAIAKVTVVGGLLWLVVAAAVAGEAGARDVAMGIYPLTYTAPVSRSDYLGGRFLAALALNAVLLLAVQVGSLAAIYIAGVDAAVLGPFRPAAWLTNYAFIALPNAVFITAIQFAMAVRAGRPMAAYVGSFLLIFVAFFVASMMLFSRGWGRLLDPIGILYVLSDLSHQWTSYEKSWRLIALEGTVLANRLVWLGIGAGALALTWAAFRFAHRAESTWWWRRGRADARAPEPAGTGLTSSTAIAVPQLARTFGPTIQVRKTLAIAWESFRTIATSWAGLGVLTAIPLLTILVIIDQVMPSGAPLVPATMLVLRELTGPLSDELSRWIFVPFVIVFFAGELIWREREAGLDEITDAMPGSEWTPLVGKFLGLSLFLALFSALLMAAGMAAQLMLGHRELEASLYFRVLFGLQLPEYLLFVPLALAVHALVDQKYIGHLVAMLAYVVIVLAPMFGIEHNLLIYGAGPTWSYTEMRGFGPSLGPWVWFKLYWAAWALLLAVTARLLWVRGRETGLGVRLRLARRRFVPPTAWTAATAVGLVLVLGGFVFYNTNMLNEYRSTDEIAELRAEYERRYGQYRDVPQPELTGASLHVEIHPERREVDVRGSYRLVNASGEAIDSIHLTLVPGVANGPVTFDRPAVRVHADEDMPHTIYALEEPLQPGDSLRLDFHVRIAPQGFRESGAMTSLAANATTFNIDGWLPDIGYQVSRELTSPAERREYGLPARPFIPSLADADGWQDRGQGIVLETVVSTDEDQVAVAPGALRRSWNEGGRSYFHYVTDAPIGTEWTVASADYAVRQVRWDDPEQTGRAVDIRIYHHPEHTAHLDRMDRAIRASLDYYTREFGPYPYGHLTLIEQPAIGTGMHADASVITFTEGTSFWAPNDDPDDLYLPFAVVAHEMAHQWTVPSAPVEGAPVMSESLAWYYAMRVVEETQPQQLHALLRFMREPHVYPPIRRGEPLLRGVDPYMAYRRGPFALHALSEYAGEDAVNRALRSLLAKHDAEGAPLATTLDLYRELQAVTPDSLRYLLHDLFEVNTFWHLQTDGVTAEQTEDGTWEVTLDVQARKVVVDSAGVETEVPMDEWIEIGVFAPAVDGAAELSEPLYVQKHRIRSGAQTVRVTVPRRPLLAGIDPYHVLDWEERGDDDNIDGVEIGR
ncbi:MAG TPA: hypothetical protein VHG09_04800 [Longimicrobiales bacterium]|nr:hypothetical protein [Longimicrobiales bacterium]